MLKIIAFIYLCWVTCLLGHSQLLPQKCEAFCPSVLNKATIYQVDIEKLADNNYGQNGSSTNKYWDVYSDRCDNVVYNGPNTSSGTTGKKLSFNQKVRIAEVKNGFAWVYIENRPGGANYPQLSSDCQEVGWVPMENLLLWTSCPTNEHGIYRKALILNNIEQKLDESFRYISQHPDVNNTPSVSETKADICIHYIMKEVGNRYLIANNNRLSGTTTDQVLEGWVLKNSVLPWTHRVCLEPNWNQDDVDFFVSHNEQVFLYEDANFIKRAQLWTYGKKNSEGQPSTQYRMRPHSMRFPLLESDNDSLFHIIAFTNPQLLAYEGYTKKDDGLEHDYWKAVVFLSSEELVELIKKLEPLKTAVKVNTYGTQERANYVKAVTSIIQSMTVRSAEEIEQLSTDEITRIIGGLIASTPMLKGKQSEKTYTLSDIKDPNLCPEKDFMSIIIKMRNTIDDLSSLPKGQNFKYSFTQNGSKYYWIPVDMLP